MKINSQEQFRRTLTALQETANMIGVEKSYSDHLQNKQFLKELENHRDDLSAVIREYQPL